MRVFITGGTGFIGSALIPDLLDGGHQVLALVRPQSSITPRDGLEVVRGSIEDLDLLRAGAESCDAVAHLAFGGLENAATAVPAERAALETFGEVLKGQRLIVASGGPTGRESDPLREFDSPRMASLRMVPVLAEKGVQVSQVRIAPTTHDATRCWLVSVLARTASVHNFAAFVGDGSNRLPSAHRLDVAHLFRLALEKAPAGSNLHGVGEEGVPMRAVAEEIGRQLGLPVRSIPPEEATAHFGALGFLVGLDLPASNALTRERLGWEPAGPGLLADLAAGQYLNS